MARFTQFVTGNIYHIYNRGVRKGNIFFDNADYRRWEDVLYWCLTYDYPYSRYKNRIRQGILDGGDSKKVANEITQEMDQIYRLETSPVEILCYAHMPNHFHLSLRQTVDRGINDYMHRISTSFSKYINERYELSGSLYQGSYRAVAVLKDEQFLQLSRYIHINPLAAGLTARKTLVDYPWTSFGSYLKNQQNKMLARNFLLEYFSSVPDLVEFTLAPFAPEDSLIMENISLDDDFAWFGETRKEKKDQAKNKIRAV